MSDQKLKVLYITGPARSGSTILQNILGEIDGFFAAGELHYLWRRALDKDCLCGCGTSVRRCDIWSEVLEQVLYAPVVEGADLPGLLRWQRETVRLRHTWKLLRQGTHSRNASLVELYASAIAGLYRAIARVTGARVIVDSSKKSSGAALLHLLPEIEPYVIHLVRDPRAVAYSWSRRKINVDENGRLDRLPQHGALFSSLQWMQVNLMTEAVRRRGDHSKSVLIRYEDFTGRLPTTVEGIVDLVGERPRKFPFLDDQTVRLSVNHTVWGNIDRFRTGVVSVREDAEWHAKMSVRDRVLSSAVTIPLLHRYGYDIRPEEPSAPRNEKREA
jgi:Sulfotransferase family